MAHAQLRLDAQLCFAIYEASHAVAQAYKPLLEPLGLTYPQYVAMLALWERDAISLKQLGRRLRLDSGTLTPLIKRLEQQGLVTRLRAEADERRLQITLTEAGRALEQQALEIPATLFCRMGLTSLDELHALRDALRAITLAVRQPSETHDDDDAPTSAHTRGETP